MMQLFGRLMKLPLEAFIFSMDMLVKTMRGMQAIAYQGIDMMTDQGVHNQSPVEVSGHDSHVLETTQATPEVTYAVPALSPTVPEGTSIVPDVSRRHTEAPSITIQEKEKDMPDTDLQDDQLKLVRYKVLFVKRDLEHAFMEQEELVPENTNEIGYTAWKIAEFIQHLDTTDVPDKWKSKNYPPESRGGKIYKLPEDDKKYLRVYYEVLSRYAREKFRYEERQIEILEDIANQMKTQRPQGSSQTASGAASGSSGSGNVDPHA
jgi:hypothetical protein